MARTSGALKRYNQVHVQGEESGADLHRLIQMLFEGALDRVAMAKAFLKPGNVTYKGEAFSKAMSNIDGLRMCLDHKVGGEIAHNLDGLYDYMNRRLLQAHGAGEQFILDEVSHLLSEIKSAWHAISGYAVSMPARPQTVVVGQVPVVD